MRITTNGCKNFREYFLLYVEYLLWVRWPSVLLLALIGVFACYFLFPMRLFFYNLTTLLISLIFVIPLVRYLRLKKHGVLRDKCTYFLSQEGIQKESEAGIVKDITWDLVKTVKKTPHFVFLICDIESERVIIIPRAVLTRENELVHKIRRNIDGAKAKADLQRRSGEKKKEQAQVSP